MNRVYGFEGEVVHKYSRKMFEVFTEVFNALPLAAQIVATKNNKKALVLHGGLFSKDNVTLQDIKGINRFGQPPDSGTSNQFLSSQKIRDFL